MRGDGGEAVAARASDEDVRASARRAGLPQAVDRLARGHRGHAGPIPRDLGRQQIGVLARREADDLKVIGMRVDDRERAPADGAGGAEDGDALHGQEPNARLKPT